MSDFLIIFGIVVFSAHIAVTALAPRTIPDGSPCTTGSLYNHEDFGVVQITDVQYKSGSDQVTVSSLENGGSYVSSCSELSSTGNTE